MDYDAVLAQVLALLQQEKRLSYRVLKRRLHLDDDVLEDLKEDLIYAKKLALDEDNRVLVWAGEHPSAFAPPSDLGTPAQAAAPSADLARAPLAYTPPYLAEKILTSRSALEGERKQVTVLFADLKSSMELLADRDPEEARQLLDPVLERMMAAVHRYEGTVNQVMGDGIMALFGAPLAHEDHAVRACYAALAMQEAIRSYADQVRQTHHVEIQSRVGLHSGEVVVRAIGNDLHMDYSAIGQTTHLAARMEQLATPGSILLTTETFRLAEEVVQVKPLGPTPIRGLRQPLEVFELVGAGSPRTRLQAFAARSLTRFVGRQAESEAMRHAHALAGTGHGQLIAVIGEPGVGKTRLFYECLCAPWTHGWLLLASQATSYSQAAPYHPVRELLTAYFQLEARHDVGQIHERVTRKLCTLDAALEPTLPAMLALVDVPVDDRPWQALDPPQRRQRTLDALKRLLLRESQVQPVLLVCENLHWIDTETQAFLDSLVESLPTARMLLLVNYRPEYQHSWGNKTYYTQIRLDPLPPMSAAALLHSLLGDDASMEPLTQRLSERTQGNPFFLEESVRTLVETQVLVGSPGAYRLAMALPSIQVPATVQAVLAARIDRLPPEEKQLLQTAAVIGTEVPLALLQAIAEVPEEALQRRLAHVQAAEFLYETRLFPERAYTFKHALTHDVAYGSLLQERRRALHARIVEALETLAGDRLAEQVDRLAHHALRGQVWDKAFTYCRQAGTKAYAGSAYREAVGYWEQALEALAHLPPDRPMLEHAVDVRCDLYHALHALAQYEQKLSHLRVAEPLAEELADHRRLGSVYRSLANTLREIQDYEPALAYSQRAHAMATALGEVGLQLESRLATGWIYHDLGDYRQALEHLQQALMTLQGASRSQSAGLGHGLGLGPGHRLGNRPIITRTWIVLCLSELGAFADGVACGTEALQSAEAVDRPIERLAAYGRVGYLHVRQGTLNQAIPLLERGVALSQEANIPLYYSATAQALALAYALAGRATDALAILGQSEGSSVVRGEAYLRSGEVEEADRLAQRGLANAREHNRRGEEAWTLWLLGEIAMQRDLPDAAQVKAHYQQALALAEALGMRPLQAHGHLGLGMLYTTTGQREQAHTALSTAIAMYRTMAMTFWLPQAAAALVEVETH